MKPRPKRIGVVSDLHCGSIYGLIPPGFITSDDREFVPNAGQRYLWECWKDAAKFLNPLDALVVNGDVIDGNQDKQKGTELALPLFSDQAEAAFLCIDWLRKHTGNPKIYCLQGTEYHEGRAGREAEVVAEKLGAVRYSGLGTGRWCREALDLEVDGVILNFSHGISVSAGLYRATPPDREAVWSALAGKVGKAARADCVVRAHAHHFVHVEHPSKHCYINPCWQLQTRFMRKNSSYRMLPDIGCTWINVSGQDKREGVDPCHVEKRIYPLPEPRIAHL